MSDYSKATARAVDESNQQVTPRPVALTVRPDLIPEQLKRLRRWVCWRYEWLPTKGKREGRWSKPPLTPNGRRASTTNPATYSTFDAVLAAYLPGHFDGIGIVMEFGDG